MRCLAIESPYAAPDAEALARHLEYARAALADSLRRGEAPFASHLLYTQPGVLDDDVPVEREAGIAAGLALSERLDAHVFYVDLGWSRGMLGALREALRLGRPVEVRSLDGWASGALRVPRALYLNDRALICALSHRRVLEVFADDDPTRLLLRLFKAHPDTGYMMAGEVTW